MIGIRIGAVLVALLFAGAAAAQEAVEALATAEEAERVNAAIAAFNCAPHAEIEKETDDLYELDDAACEAGQYDIKLDGAFTVVSMTYDGPIDAGD